VSRGKAFTFAHWEGAVIERNRSNLRTRLVRWLPDGIRLVAIGDDGNEEAIVVIHGNGFEERIEHLDIGRPVELVPSPKDDLIVLSNHRFELILIDLKRKKASIIDKHPYEPTFGAVFSPDGCWVAYHLVKSPHTSVIKLLEVSSRKTREITGGEFRDHSPAFDPDGKYLFFLSHRDFDPVYDTQLFDLSFPRSMRPCLVTLRKDVPSPFVPLPRPPGGKTGENHAENSARKKSEKPKPIVIDFDRIQDRVLAFPVSDGCYGKISGLPGGKVVWSSFPIEGSLKKNWFDVETDGKGNLEKYDFEELRRETLFSGISTFSLSQDSKTMLVRYGNKLRVLKAGEKPDEKFEKEPPNRKNGWLDLSRLSVEVDPAGEWRQIFRQAWRLQRDNFWTHNLSGVDWELVFKRYYPFLEKIASRSELSDLIWEMQGELGTSHAYEIGGDYRSEPNFSQGFLGADLSFDPKKKKWNIAHIVRGDGWEEGRDSPLNAPGLQISEGTLLVSVNGIPLNQRNSPYELFMNRANREVNLEIINPGKKATRSVVVKLLSDETKARYREWVRKNREKVHSLSKGRVGYVHIPDMGAIGYSEFHRAYLAEVEHEGLLIDVRCNGGGHVSQLILEKLARKRVGYCVSRWNPPEAYPTDSPRGPIVALTDEQAGRLLESELGAG
ncbi:PDZ domain-containing protein, partial [bacterium]|nr:PDZ domain-containing protein [bacterium]